MKLRNIILTGLLFLFTSSILFANQLNDDFFADRWQVQIFDTPDGDHTMVMALKRDGDNLTGWFEGPDGTRAEIERIQEAENSITVYWTAEGYYVSLQLDKKDDNNLTGNLLHMFNSTAERIID